jgi:hypothetical protein
MPGARSNEGRRSALGAEPFSAMARTTATRLERDRPGGQRFLRTPDPIFGWTGYLPARRGGGARPGSPGRIVNPTRSSSTLRALKRAGYGDGELGADVPVATIVSLTAGVRRAFSAMAAANSTNGPRHAPGRGAANHEQGIQEHQDLAPHVRPLTARHASAPSGEAPTNRSPARRGPSLAPGPCLGGPFDITRKARAGPLRTWQPPRDA